MNTNTGIVREVAEGQCRIDEMRARLRCAEGILQGFLRDRLKERGSFNRRFKDIELDGGAGGVAVLFSVARIVTINGMDLLIFGLSFPDRLSEVLLLARPHATLGETISASHLPLSALEGYEQILGLLLIRLSEEFPKFKTKLDAVCNFGITAE